jgi:hypothetical protein
MKAAKANNGPLTTDSEPNTNLVMAMTYLHEAQELMEKAAGMNVLPDRKARQLYKSTYTVARLYSHLQAKKLSTAKNTKKPKR